MATWSDFLVYFVDLEQKNVLIYGRSKDVIKNISPPQLEKILGGYDTKETLLIKSIAS